MHSCYDVWRQGRLHELAMLSHNAEILAQQGLRGSSAQAHQNFRFHCRELRIQPGTAGIDLPVARFLVDAPFSTLIWRPVEMLHHIRNIYITSRDANLCQSLIKQPSGWTHERMTSEIFSISGLLANEDDFSMCVPFAEHRLGSSVRGFFAENTGETVLESSTATYNVRREISAQVAPWHSCRSKLRKISF